ncbi:MAG: response regulator [Bacteroidota bacterium]
MHSRTPKLFIVEDNFMYSYTLESIFKERENFKVTSLSSGRECIELLDNNPDVIILDYNLESDMTGFDIFKTIHAKKPLIPVIIISSQSDLQIVSDLLKNGAFDYIEKKSIEVTIEKLHQSVLKALKSKL